MPVLKSSPWFRSGGQLILALFCWAPGQSTAGEAPPHRAVLEQHGPASAQTRTNSWGTIVVIGASASAGFTETEPLGGPKTPQFQLSRYLDAALVAPHEPVRNFANTFFFMQPVVAGRRQVEQAMAAKPALVIGLDFMFWFCYGEGTEAERLNRLELGLKLLEPLTCPLVLGDIPDASAANNRMLGPEQIPSAATLARANRRLKQWAANQQQVRLVPLAAIMHNASTGKAVTLHGLTVSDGRNRALLQDDNLHPSRLGAAVLALAALDAFISEQHTHKTSEVLWEPYAVLRAATVK